AATLGVTREEGVQPDLEGRPALDVLVLGHETRIRPRRGRASPGSPSGHERRFPIVAHPSHYSSPKFSVSGPPAMLTAWLRGDRPAGDVDTVVVGRAQGEPERWVGTILDDLPAGGYCRLNPLLELVSGDADVDVEAATARSRVAEGMERSTRVPPGGVDRVVLDLLVAERRRPEGTHRGVRVVGDGEAEHRETGGVGRDTHLRGDAGDGPGQGDVEIGQLAKGERERPGGYAVGTEIDVGVMPHLLRRIGDALDETGGL